MNFFKQLSEIIDGVDITLTIRKSDNELTILLQPKATKEGAKTSIKPLSIRATPEELDEQFFNTISSTMKKATGIIASIEVFEQDMENAKKSFEEKAKKKRETIAPKKAVATTTIAPKKEEPQQQEAERGEEGQQEAPIDDIKDNAPEVQAQATQVTQASIF